MTALVNLPDSVLLDMLTCGCLNAKDILQFGLTCSRFHTLTLSNIIWKKLFDQTWPGLLKKDGSFLKVLNTLTVSHDGNTQTASSAYLHWKYIYQQTSEVIAEVWNLYENHFIDDQIDDKFLTVFECLIKKYTYSFLRELLLASCEEHCQFSDLTLKYYSHKVLRYISWGHVAKGLKLLIDDGCKEAEDNQHSVEMVRQLSSVIRGVLLIEKWFNFDTNLSRASIANFIAEVSDKVLFHFKSVKSSTDKNELEADLLMKSLKKVFFDDLGFCGNADDYYNITNSFLHHVIKSRKGIPILLSIIYREIASNIGIKLDCINYPQHFLLRWERDTGMTDKDHLCYRFIDVFNGGAMKTYSELTAGVRDVSILTGPEATTYEVLCRVCRNIDFHAKVSGQSSGNDMGLDVLNLCILLMPDDYEYLLKRINKFYTQGFNLDLAIEDNRKIKIKERTTVSLPSCKEVENILLTAKKENEKRRENYSPSIHLRTCPANEGVKYAVGMIMKHRRYDYQCIIRGWDNFCDMPQQWILHMGVDELERKDKQPFYHVLVNDGSERYAAEDNLQPFCNPDKVKHKEIGRYFSKFVTDDSTNYSYLMPNSQLALRYPQDSDATRDFYVGHPF
ncbi:unnamed protein product [Clavelina lepadiformis]|uniref:Hemimethylated DNA-binding domain-containing protein n=1 Tax=Clavelina lepadiformis TaxID=159417 RepID=A0ABP0GRL1_CLALP